MLSGNQLIFDTPGPPWHSAQTVDGLGLPALHIRGMAFANDKPVDEAGIGNLIWDRCRGRSRPDAWQALNELIPQLNGTWALACIARMALLYRDEP